MRTAARIIILTPVAICFLIGWPLIKAIDWAMGGQPAFGGYCQFVREELWNEV